MVQVVIVYIYSSRLWFLNKQNVCCASHTSLFLQLDDWQNWVIKIVQISEHILFKLVSDLLLINQCKGTFHWIMGQIIFWNYINKGLLLMRIAMFGVASMTCRIRHIPTLWLHWFVIFENSPQNNADEILIGYIINFLAVEEICIGFSNWD